MKTSNKMKRFLASLLAIICLVSSINFIPANAAGNEDVPKTTQLEAFGGGDVSKAKKGVQITFDRKSPGWARIRSVEMYSSTGDGFTIEMESIACANPDYSVAVKFGDDREWYNGRGYMIIYGKSGNFSIITTSKEKQTVNKAPVLVSEKREELRDSLSINVKLQGNNYIITVNGKTYSVAANHLEDKENHYLVFGAMSDGEISVINAGKSYETSALTYTISKISNMMVGAGYDPKGDLLTASDVGVVMTGENIELREAENGVQAALTTEAKGYERFHFKNPLSLDGTPLEIDLQDIYSADDDYSMVVRLGESTGRWYNGKGYMFVYGKSGNFAIIGMDQNEMVPTKSIIYVSEKREPLDGKLNIQVELQDDQYVMNVNDKTYTVPTSCLEKPESVYLGFGAFCDGDIKSINFSKSFKKAAFAFVIGKDTYAKEPEAARTIKPLAKYETILEGNKEEKLTRRDAIVAIAKLLIDRDDIKNVYSSDFTDLKKKDKDYDVFAYMQRCGWLPDFGEKLEPDKTITREEFMELLLVDEYVPNVEASDDSITRGEAAEAIASYLGKSSADETLKLHEETFTVTADGKDTIQSCIDKAIELSKTTDARVTIELSDDVYQLAQPITINGESYGEHELVIIIKNADGVAPILTGNVEIKASEFKQVKGKSYYSYQLPESSKVDGVWPEFRDFYLNGERLELAKSERYTFEMNFKDPVYQEGSTAIKGYTNCMYVDSTIFDNITNENIEPLEIIVNGFFMEKRMRLESILPQEVNRLTCVAAKALDWRAYENGNNKRSHEGDVYWFENHLTLLDEPGEFFYDDESGIVYFYPYKDTDMSKATLSYPQVEMLVNMSNVSGISFEGITFTGVTSNFASHHGYSANQAGVYTWSDDEAARAFLQENGLENTLTDMYFEHVHDSAIYSMNADHIAIRNCAFDELGGNGVFFNGSNHDMVIMGCSFTDIAMGGAIFGKQVLRWSLATGQSNIILDNNYLNNIAEDHRSNVGFNVTRVKNLAATHNTVIHTPYSGFSFGWLGEPSAAVSVHNAEIAYNRMEDNVYELDDGGSIYCCGANALTTNDAVINRIHHNYVKSTGHNRTYNGIYLDLNSSNYDVYSNVVEGYDTGHGPIFNQDHYEKQYTYNNTIRDNYTTLRTITTTADPIRNVQLINNIRVATAAEYPEAALKIIDTAGQQKEYAGSVKKNETYVIMDVEEPHITLKKNGISSREAVTFTITNNGNSKATYSVNCSNIADSGIEVISSPIDLKAGETGEVKVAFRGSKAVKNRVLTLVVEKDNGWKEEKLRAIEINVSNEEATFMENYGHLLPIMIGGAAFLLIVIVVVVIIVVKKHKKNK